MRKHSSPGASRNSAPAISGAFSSPARDGYIQVHARLRPLNCNDYTVWGCAGEDLEPGQTVVSCGISWTDPRVRVVLLGTGDPGCLLSRLVGTPSILESILETVVSSVSYGEFSVTRENGIKTFKFDSLLRTTATQAEVFDVVARGVVEGVLEGYNGCIMCYGQARSGRTYTMGGKLDAPSEKSAETMGITARALRMIFETADCDCQSDYQVTMSYVHIYQEMIQDLLDAKTEASIA